MPEYWDNLPYSADPADLQLAAGDALLAHIGGEEPRPALRWYSMSPTALILGSGQKLHEFDLHACRAASIALHRRSSGGTAVLAAPDQIMLDIALPRGHALFRHDITESYRWLGEAWMAVLQALGGQAHLLLVPEARADLHALDALTRRACYGGRSPYEVLVGGRKVIGLAQTRRRAGALLQTGIYTRWSAWGLVSLFALAPTERQDLAARLDARVAGLADVLPVAAGQELFPRVVRLFAATLRERHGIELVDAAWSNSALEARAQAAARYAALDAPA